jgi:hypothetical protein
MAYKGIPYMPDNTNTFVTPHTPRADVSFEQAGGGPPLRAMPRWIMAVRSVTSAAALDLY